MKYFLILAFLLLFSCSNSTENNHNLYEGESVFTGGIEINSDNDSIGYNDSFKIYIHFQEQKYSMKGQLELYGAYCGGWYESYSVMKTDSSLTLMSPEAKLLDTMRAGVIIDIELKKGRDTTIVWNFKSDSIKTWNGTDRYRRGFQAFIMLDSINLDMDTLYGGPWRPIAVEDKRWYSIPNDLLILTGKYGFFKQFFRSSPDLKLYYQQN